MSLLNEPSHVAGAVISFCLLCPIVLVMDDGILLWQMVISVSLVSGSNGIVAEDDACDYVKWINVCNEDAVKDCVITQRGVCAASLHADDISCC